MAAGHRPRLGARVRDLGWRLGQVDELASDSDAGSSLRRFRIGVRYWSGSAAVLWLALAIWRTVTPGSAQFAVLLLFGVLNLAVVSRVIFPGGNAA